VIGCMSGGLDARYTCGQETQTESPAVASQAAFLVDGEVERPLRLSVAELATLPRHTARVTDHNGKEALFAGPPLVEILRLTGVKLGEQLRGKELTSYILVKAADGYQVVFALAELDPGFTDRVIFLADQRDGKPLSAQEGPWRIIVPEEKRQARWVRQVLSLTVLHGGK